MNRSTAPRNPGIDLLRGLSILLVILHHVAIRIPLKRGVLSTVVPVRLLHGYLWYLPAVALSWLAGALVARFVSNPSERALRTWWAVAPRPSSATLGRDG